LGQKVSICGAPQIRRHRGGLGMDDFLLLFSVYTDYNISRRKINTDFLKAAVMLISELCVGCMSFGKAGTMHDWTLDETEKVVKHALETLSSSPRCGRH
jgi:dihydrodipicolinate synthase/N-acetylneuraminate lyase